MSTAVLPFRPPTPAGLVQLAASDVGFNLHVASIDRRRKTATCELVLANQSIRAVSGRLFGKNRQLDEQTFGALEVAPRSLGRSLFTVPLNSWNGRNDERVYVEVLGEGLHLLAAAHAPAAAKRHGGGLPELLGCAAAFILILAAAFALALGFGRPSVVALDVPQRTPAGIVRAFYSVRGRAQMNYRAMLANGTPLASGTLSASTGTIWLPVPASASGRNVRLTLDARDMLGRDSRTASFFVSPASHVPAPAAAQIRAMTAHRESYAGTNSILASYSAIADRGVLRVTDEHGKTLGSAPFTHVGTSRVPLAGTDHSGSLRAELSVVRGASRADAAVEIPALPIVAKDASVLAAGTDAAASAAQATDKAATDSGSIPLPTDPFYVTDRVVGGSRFTVRIRSALPNMHVELQDDMGSTLDDAAVPNRATSVTLVAPKVSSVQNYYLAGTFVRASGEETLVRSVRIFPR